MSSDTYFTGNVTQKHTMQLSIIGGLAFLSLVFMVANAQYPMMYAPMPYGYGGFGGVQMGGGGFGGGGGGGFGDSGGFGGLFGMIIFRKIFYTEFPFFPQKLNLGCLSVFRISNPSYNSYRKGCKI